MCALVQTDPSAGRAALRSSGAPRRSLVLVSTGVLRPKLAAPTVVAGRPKAHFLRAIAHAPPTFWAYLDMTCVAIGTFLTYRLALSGNSGYAWVASPWLTTACFCGGILLSGLIFGLYESATIGSRSRILVRSGLTLMLGLALGYATVSLLFYADITRWLTLGVAITYVLTAGPLRVVAHESASRARCAVLCIGGGAAARQLEQMLGAQRQRHYRVVGRLSVEPGEARADGAASIHLGDIRDIGEVLETRHVDEVIVASGLTHDPRVGSAVLTCLDHRVRVIDQPTFVEKYLGQVPAQDISAQWFLMADVHPAGAYEAGKRLLDIVAAAAGLLLTAPLLPFLVLAIRLDSRGPAIYHQTRVGLHGRNFRIYKFRTMGTDAEAGGVRWAGVDDPRVTRVGRFLRKTRLDELPQLWNILRGEMSLVGPRPERPEFVGALSKQIPHYRQRHLIKPGLTGWAQIHYGYAASADDAERKLCYDLYYLKHRSIDLDVAILIRTIGRFVFGSR